MIRVEAGTLADAVTKAARIAPSRSSPTFDKANGILLERDGDQLCISATDLSCSYSHLIGVLEMPDEIFRVRVPSDIFSGLMSNLPAGSGHEIRLEFDGALQVDAGRTQTTLRTLPAESFPNVRRFDEEGLATVERFSQRVKQIAWATSKKDIPLTGIFVDGEVLGACDRFRVATVPCPMPVESPVSAPLAPLTAVLRNVEDIEVRVTERCFEIVPAEDVQLTSALYALPYPDIRKAMPKGDDLICTLRFERDHFREAVSRMLAFVKADDNPQMTLTFSEEAINLDIVLPDVGELHDQIDCSDGPDEPIAMRFTPAMLSSILSNGARESMSLAMDGNPMHPVRISDASGFLAWVMPVAKVV